MKRNITATFAFITVRKQAVSVDRALGIYDRAVSLDEPAVDGERHLDGRVGLGVVDAFHVVTEVRPVDGLDDEKLAVADAGAGCVVDVWVRVIVAVWNGAAGDFVGLGLSSVYVSGCCDDKSG